MRKRLILVNILLVLVAVITLFVISVSLIIDENNDTTKIQMNNYMNLVTDYFDGSNTQETIDYFNRTIKDLRITIFDKDFDIIIDSLVDVDNGDNRPELDNLGKIFNRYSNNLNKNMLYMASSYNDYYVRISIQTSKINSFINDYFIGGSVILVIIVVLSFFASIHLAEKTLKPITSVVSKLAIIGDSSFKPVKYDEYELSKQIDSINFQIGSKLVELEKEKQKINDILESTKESIIVVNKEGNIELINENSLKIFNLVKNKVLLQSYYSLLKSNDVINLITKALESNEYGNSVISIDNYYYEVNVLEVKKLWIEGVLIILNNITDNYNLVKIKKEFFQNASHELKSPLTSIIGFQQLIKEGIYETKEEIFEGVENTIREAKRMNDIVIDMLEISNLESDIKQELTNINVKDIIKEVLTSLDLQIRKKNLNLNVVLEDLIILTNKEHLLELCKNLIENAIKYNKQDGLLNISLSNNTFIVEDSGIGIKDENLDRVFERFFREDSRKSKDLGGTGLGLSIVKHVCNVYSYDIKIKSNKNIGTIISVVLK